MVHDVTIELKFDDEFKKNAIAWMKEEFILKSVVSNSILQKLANLDKVIKSMEEANNFNPTSQDYIVKITARNTLKDLLNELEV